jgi:alpha/beta superfamily hydrolase
LIVHGTQDDLVPEASVAKLATKLSSQRNITVNYRTIAGANHSFSTKLDELNVTLDEYLAGVSLERSMAAAG